MNLLLKKVNEDIIQQIRQEADISENSEVKHKGG